MRFGFSPLLRDLEHLSLKAGTVRHPKIRQSNNLERRSDSIGSKSALVLARTFAASILVTSLAGCGAGMPSAGVMSAFSSSASPNTRSGLGGPVSARSTVAARSARSQEPGHTIIVAEGETLMSIGRRYDVPMSVLIEHNALRSIALEPGTELFVPQLQPSYRR